MILLYVDVDTCFRALLLPHTILMDFAELSHFILSLPCVPSRVIWYLQISLAITRTISQLIYASHSTGFPLNAAHDRRCSLKEIRWAAGINPSSYLRQR